MARAPEDLKTSRSERRDELRFGRRVGDARASTHEQLAPLLRSATTMAGLVPPLLELLGSAGRWDHGAFWMSDAEGRLTCLEVWRGPHDTALLEAASWLTDLELGEGLAGRAAMTGRTLWLRDVREDRTCPRSYAAAMDGVRSGVCVPVFQDGNRAQPVVAVIEFFAHDERQEDHAETASLQEVSADVGEFLQQRSLCPEWRLERSVEIQEELVETLCLAQQALEAEDLAAASRLVDQSLQISRRVGLCMESAARMTPEDDLLRAPEGWN